MEHDFHYSRPTCLGAGCLGWKWGGLYTLNDGTQGSLFNVAFIPAVNSPGAPFSAGTYSGSWALGDQSGSFVWNVNTVNFTSFTGRYLNNTTGESNNWNGQRSPAPLHP